MSCFIFTTYEGQTPASVAYSRVAYKKKECILFHVLSRMKRTRKIQIFRMNYFNCTKSDSGKAPIKLGFKTILEYPLPEIVCPTLNFAGLYTLLRTENRIVDTCLKNLERHLPCELHCIRFVKIFYRIPKLFSKSTLVSFMYKA